jgi:hypothetical protein
MNYIRNIPEVASASGSESSGIELAGQDKAAASTKTQISKVITGTAVYTVLNWLYDYPLYSIVLWYGGILWGGLFMALLSIPVDLVTLKFYDWSQQDWFAIEYLKAMKEYQGKNILKRALKVIFCGTPKWLQVIVLSIKFNAFAVTTLLRKGAYEYQGLTRSDWLVFWGSYFIGQVYWIFVIGSGLTIGSLLATKLSDISQQFLVP